MEAQTAFKSMVIRFGSRVFKKLLVIFLKDIANDSVPSRIFNFKKEWWNTKSQSEIQSWSDVLCSTENPSDMNQALMELGATVCTPKSPACLICPWSKVCLSFKTQTQDIVPLPRPKKTKEIWIWSPQIYKNKNNELMLVENNEVSFLSKKWVFPGQAIKVKKKPTEFSYKHTITNHDIYVCVEKSKTKPLVKSEPLLFIKPENLSKKSPFSLMKKALDHI